MEKQLSPKPPIARLAALVRESGLTQADVAERAGMMQSSLSRLLSGENDPAVSRVGRVLTAIGCTWADLDGPA